MVPSIRRSAAPRTSSRIAAEISGRQQEARLGLHRDRDLGQVPVHLCDARRLAAAEPARRRHGGKARRRRISTSSSRRRSAAAKAQGRPHPQGPRAPVQRVLQDDHGRSPAHDHPGPRPEARSQRPCRQRPRRCRSSDGRASRPSRHTQADAVPARLRIQRPAAPNDANRHAVMANSHSASISRGRAGATGSAISCSRRPCC